MGHACAAGGRRAIAGSFRPSPLVTRALQGALRERVLLCGAIRAVAIRAAGLEVLHDPGYGSAGGGMALA
ncbi:hypothetical protein [Acidithiobacillus sulfuriphilus]|uniref:Uncharacterized protein n=1 Tax=Acidithiobacillus sulfuriphilus TaxID=1867749 RepID=A0ACD5HS26_9PROT|nr:hypothetical protein [Acidithiobacillus sulfuriphilus]